MSATIDQLKQRIQQLDDLVRAGALSAEQAAEGRAQLEKQLVEAVMAGAAAPAATAAPAAAPTPAAATTPVAAAARASTKLWVGMGVFVAITALVGYRLVGHPEALGVGPGADNGASVAQQQGGEDSHSMNNEQVEGMVKQLAAKLEKDPNNAEGWGMLGRSYAAMERYTEAVEAYRKGLKIKPDDAELLSDYADALAMVQGRNLQGEPAEAVARALKADPTNFKALSLGGTIAFEKQDYKQAADLWARAVDRAPTDNPPLARQIREALAEARQRAGLPSDEKSAPVASSGPHVSGTITLSAKVRDQVQPDDTVFIFARSVNGPRVPLAIIRKQVKDLPFQFTLDDTQAMSPKFTVSGAQEVVVAARVSRSGEAMPKDGDLAGESAVVKVGSEGVQVEIAHPITVSR